MFKVMEVTFARKGSPDRVVVKVVASDDTTFSVLKRKAWRDLPSALGQDLDIGQDADRLKTGPGRYMPCALNSVLWQLVTRRRSEMAVEQEVSRMCIEVTDVNKAIAVLGRLFPDLQCNRLGESQVSIFGDADTVAGIQSMVKLLKRVTISPY